MIFVLFVFIFLKKILYSGHTINGELFIYVFIYYFMYSIFVIAILKKPFPLHLKFPYIIWWKMLVVAMTFFILFWNNKVYLG